ncbi:MAG: hypothetical protein JJW00_04675 [Sulfurimonas sp.]|nr:hypothetical protein [Sulfurimonas sp.]
MKRIIFLIVMAYSLTFANTQEDLLEEIKILVEQNGQKIEQNGQKIEQNGMKIEQNGQKIEQNGQKIANNSADIKTMQKQVSYVQTLLSIVIAGVISIPFFTIYLQRRDDKHVERETKENSDKISKLLMALKELSEDDPKVKRSLRVAGIV